MPSPTRRVISKKKIMSCKRASQSTEQPQAVDSVTLRFAEESQLVSLPKVAEKYGDACRSITLNDFNCFGPVCGAGLLKNLPLFTQLKSLEMDKCRLQKFPVEAIKSVSDNLVSLTVTRNSFTEIPFGILLYLTKVQMFDLSNNQLSTLPSDICFMHALQNLILNNNCITTLPPIKFNSLCNRTTAQPSPRMHAIKASDNNIESLPLELLGLHYDSIDLSIKPTPDTYGRISGKLQNDGGGRVATLEQLAIQAVAELHDADNFNLKYDVPDILHNLFDGLRQCVICGKLLSAKAAQIYFADTHIAMRRLKELCTDFSSNPSWSVWNNFAFHAVCCTKHFENPHLLQSKSDTDLLWKIECASTVPLGLQQEQKTPAADDDDEETEVAESAGAFEVPRVKRVAGTKHKKTKHKKIKHECWQCED